MLGLMQYFNCCSYGSPSLTRLQTYKDKGSITSEILAGIEAASVWQVLTKHWWIRAVQSYHTFISLLEASPPNPAQGRCRFCLNSLLCLDSSLLDGHRPYPCIQVTFLFFSFSHRMISHLRDHKGREKFGVAEKGLSLELGKLGLNPRPIIYS